MGQILKDIYTDVSIASMIGFKGGSAAYFFYGLPRFSVDLDFDLLTIDKKSRQIVFKKIKVILKQYGIIKDSYIKRFTIFMLLSYGDTDHNIKIEISTRETSLTLKDYYELKEYLGISMLTAKKEYLFASKLLALTRRKETAMRDIYDIYFFAKNLWEINDKIIDVYVDKTIKEYLADCLVVIEKIKDNQILQGLGELVAEKEKIWIKQHLKFETIFMLKNYMSAIK